MNSKQAFTAFCCRLQPPIGCFWSVTNHLRSCSVSVRIDCPSTSEEAVGESYTSLLYQTLGIRQGLHGVVLRCCYCLGSGGYRLPNIWCREKKKKKTVVRVEEMGYIGYPG